MGGDWGYEDEMHIASQCAEFDNCVKFDNWVEFDNWIEPDNWVESDDVSGSHNSYMTNFQNSSSGQILTDCAQIPICVDGNKWSLISNSGAAQLFDNAPAVLGVQDVPQVSVPGQANTAWQQQVLATSTPDHDSLPRRRQCICSNCIERSSNTDRNSPSSSNGMGVRKIEHNCHWPGCNKTYSRNQKLKAHLLWHTGDWPFACSWLHCDKRFTSSDQLQRHKLTHTREKRFSCPECDKKFGRADHLSSHRKTHVAKKTAQGISWRNK